MRRDHNRREPSRSESVAGSPVTTASASNRQEVMDGLLGYRQGNAEPTSARRDLACLPSPEHVSSASTWCSLVAHPRIALNPEALKLMTPTHTEVTGTLAARFLVLSGQWKASTALTSSSSAMIAHPAYQAIIALGLVTVPLILRDLERSSAHWFEALQAITGADPVAEQNWGDISAMRDAWLIWGRQQGLA